jgi:D-3-phosphoglycerate dehydrogenase
MASTVIITAPVHPFLVETLKSKGYEIMYEPAISYESLSVIIEDAIGLIVTTRLKIDAASNTIKVDWQIGKWNGIN